MRYLSMPPAPAAAGGATTVDLSAATLTTGVGVYNAGSSSLGETSSLVYDSGDPGRLDASFDADTFFFTVTASMDWDTCAGVILQATWTSAPNLAYGVYLGLADTTTLGANIGLYGGAVLTGSATGGNNIGANPTNTATGPALDSGGSIAVMFLPSAADTRFRGMLISSWDAGFSSSGRQVRDVDPGATMSIAASGTLYGCFALGHNASLGGGTIAGLKITSEIVTRVT